MWKAGSLILLCLLVCRTAGADEIRFNRDVRPILSDKCFQCHGPDDNTREADLRLDEEESAAYVLEQSGDYPAELVARITEKDPDLRMPPAHSKKSLTQEEIDILVRWVEAGAPYEGHWAFFPPQRPPPPDTARDEWVSNGIDAFVLARLREEGLTPSEEADKETLLRRVTLDLTGLPPTLEEIDAFLADDSPSAYETVVDRLLNSPRYGEHQAASWLEAARYADTDGYQNDRYRHMSPWRDWVITAFNQNMPFDQFTVEQLAGDMLPGATFTQQVATGFGRNHRINSEAGSIPEEWIVEYVVDRVDTVGTIWLGLTVGCARCHDHKFDPISQKDYYQLFAYFNNMPEWGIGPNDGNSPPFVPVPESWPNLSDEENQFVTPAPPDIYKTQGAVLRPKPGGPETVMVMHELEERRPTYLLERGLYNQPDKSEELSPAVLDVLAGYGDAEATDRLELAKWLVSGENPLTARVTVNRLWQQYFGTGLVRTSENFGAQGELPSHSELLDWLACEFVDSGWNLKAMHKLIVTSSTYKQSSRATPQLLQIDPENRLLARGPRHRLSAMALRDQVLAVSGLLVEHLGGESVKPYMPPKLWSSISNNKYVQDHGDKLYRRSLYTYWRRTIPPPTMVNFNAAEREVCVVRKDRTNTPLQALTLMNNITFVEAARFLAERMIREPGDDTAARLVHGFRLAAGRAPDDEELSVLTEAYETYRAALDEDPEGAAGLLEVGEKPRDESLDVLEHATMTMVASTILNLDEVISKE